MNKTLLNFLHVSKSYKSGETYLSILEDISFEIREGESVAITGKSGSGKSTLLNLAGGLDSSTSGSIFFRDEKLHTMNDMQLSSYRNAHIGFVFQSHILLEDFNALENVMIPALIRGESKNKVVKRATALLERVSMTDRLYHKSSKLSGGERQRVAICRALINNPEIIIADEPTGSLDEESSAAIETLLLNIVKEENRTLLLVTHDKHFATRCSTVYLLQHRSIGKM
ncbi:MAG: ABC transporter ATP-binding protein [Sphaerochaetaceae bacterium]|nr:ABC transporter ATP-binding protein [Sphaerochaetaceae bacterium]MDC7247744.1 ABC transporter ATP-binding protein [Sphaerochaetaceae bacterium]